MKEKLLEMLADIRPECDFTENVDFIKGGLLDSMDIVVLVDEIQEEFDVTIPGTEISMNNFNSLDAILKLIEKYK